MNEAKRLSTLKKAIDVFKPAMVTFQQEHRAYKFQVAVSIVFHTAVDHIGNTSTSGANIGNGCCIHRCFSSSRRCESSAIEFHRVL